MLLAVLSYLYLLSFQRQTCFNTEYRDVVNHLFNDITFFWYFSSLPDIFLPDINLTIVTVTCNCNDRGTCISTGTMYDMYVLADSGITSAASQYSLWDAHHTTSCVCDLGESNRIIVIQCCLCLGDGGSILWTGFRRSLHAIYRSRIRGCG